MEPEIRTSSAASPFVPSVRDGSATRTGVLIVGAGPTGLALACGLRMHGIDVAVIDKAAGPATTSRALGLQPRGTEILDRLGALGDLPRRAVDVAAANVFAGQRRLLRVPVPGFAGVAEPGVLTIPQTEIEAQLRARLAELGGEVRWGTELVAAQDRGSGIAVSLQAAGGRQAVVADWLVGCDGAHSKARKLAGIAFDGAAFAERFLLADVQLDWSRSPREVSVWLHADGMFAAMPLPGVWRLMAELPAEVEGAADHSGASMGDAAAIAHLQRLLRERTGDAVTRISDPIWVSVFRFHRRLASSYRRGRIILAGDAAHIHSPFGGQGMNTGLGDAYNLGWKLALVMQGRAGESLLDSYEAERRPVAADVLKSTTKETNFLLGKNALARLLRDWVILPMAKLPPIQRREAASGSQLKVSYRGGPLARPPGSFSRLAGRLGSGPAPGDRGPDARCLLRPAGEPTTLGRQTSGGWALLLFGGADEALAACAAAARSWLGADLRVVRIAPGSEDAAPFADVVLEDRDGAIARLYRPGKTAAVLLRPDGHLAWRAARPAAAKLCEWLDGALGRDATSVASPWRLTYCASA